MKRSTAAVLLLITVLVASCTIEKRHYRNGFYVNRSGAAHTENAADDLAQPVAPRKENPLARVLPLKDTLLQQQRDGISYAAPAPSFVKEQPAAVPETRVEPTVNTEKKHAPAPIEKNKKQAVGAGIAAALFFALGMVGLIIKGTAPPVGIFIGAAFVCCILCILLASFLYPREPKIKQPKEPAVTEEGRVPLRVALGVIIAGIVIFGGIFAYLIMSILFSL